MPDTRSCSIRVFCEKQSVQDPFRLRCGIFCCWQAIKGDASVCHQAHDASQSAPSPPDLPPQREEFRSLLHSGHSGPDAFDFTSSCLTARVLSPGICCQMWHNSLWNLFARNCQDVFLRLEWRTWGHQGCQGPIYFSPYPVHVLQMIECNSALFKAPEVYGI